MTVVSTLESSFGVSVLSSLHAFSDRRRWYFSTMRFAWSQVDESGYAGPEAIISSGSPMMSDSTIAYTLAGAQANANFPPFTAESRLRTVFISTISAPLAKSAFVRAANSSAGISGFSNKADPPPESKNSTVSSSERPDTSSRARSVPRNDCSSGTGCPASISSKPAIGPFA